MQKAFMVDLRKVMKINIKPETGQILHLSTPSVIAYLQICIPALIWFFSYRAGAFRHF